MRHLDLLSFASNWWRKVFYMAEIGEDVYDEHEFDEDAYGVDAYSSFAADFPSWRLSRPSAAQSASSAVEPQQT